MEASAHFGDAKTNIQGEKNNSPDLPIAAKVESGSDLEERTVTEEATVLIFRSLQEEIHGDETPPELTSRGHEWSMSDDIALKALTGKARQRWATE